MNNKRSPWDWVEVSIVALIVLYLFLRFDERAQDGWLAAVFLILLGLLILKIVRLIASR